MTIVEVVRPIMFTGVFHIGIGNLVSIFGSGPKFGCNFIWMLAFSFIISTVFHILSAHISFATKKKLPRVFRDEYPSPVCFLIWILCEFSMCASDLIMITCASICLNMLFGLHMLLGATLMNADVLLLRWFHPYVRSQASNFINFAPIGVLIFSCISLLNQESRSSRSPFNCLFFFNSLHLSFNYDMLFNFICVLGANLPPHLLYLHSAPDWNLSRVMKKYKTSDFCCLYTIGIISALAMGFFMNLAFILSAEAFLRKFELGNLTENVLYNFGPISIFSIIFAFMYFYSTISTVSIGQIISQGFLQAQISDQSRLLFTRCLSLIPVLLSFFYNDLHGALSATVYAQVSLSFISPIILVLTLKLASSPMVMGEFRISQLFRMISWGCLMIVLFGNLWFLLDSSFKVGGERDEIFGMSFWELISSGELLHSESEISFNYLLALLFQDALQISAVIFASTIAGGTIMLAFWPLTSPLSKDVDTVSSMFEQIGIEKEKIRGITHSEMRAVHGEDSENREASDSREFVEKGIIEDEIIKKRTATNVIAEEQKSQFTDENVNIFSNFSELEKVEVKDYDWSISSLHNKNPEAVEILKYNGGVIDSPLSVDPQGSFIGPVNQIDSGKEDVSFNPSNSFIADKISVVDDDVGDKTFPIVDSINVDSSKNLDSEESFNVKDEIVPEPFHSETLILYSRSEPILEKQNDKLESVSERVAEDYLNESKLVVASASLVIPLPPSSPSSPSSSTLTSSSALSAPTSFSSSSSSFPSLIESNKGDVETSTTPAITLETDQYTVCDQVCNSQSDSKCKQIMEMETLQECNTLPKYAESSKVDIQALSSNALSGISDINSDLQTIQRVVTTSVGERQSLSLPAEFGPHLPQVAVSELAQLSLPGSEPSESFVNVDNLDDDTVQDGLAENSRIESESPEGKIAGDVGGAHDSGDESSSKLSIPCSGGEIVETVKDIVLLDANGEKNDANSDSELDPVNISESGPSSMDKQEPLSAHKEDNSLIAEVETNTTQLHPDSLENKVLLDIDANEVPPLNNFDEPNPSEKSFPNETEISQSTMIQADESDKSKVMNCSRQPASFNETVNDKVECRIEEQEKSISNFDAMNKVLLNVESEKCEDPESVSSMSSVTPIIEATTTMSTNVPKDSVFGVSSMESAINTEKIARVVNIELLDGAAGVVSQNTGKHESAGSDVSSSDALSLSSNSFELHYQGAMPSISELHPLETAPSLPCTSVQSFSDNTENVMRENAMVTQPNSTVECEDSDASKMSLSKLKPKLVGKLGIAEMLELEMALNKSDEDTELESSNFDVWEGSNEDAREEMMRDVPSDPSYLGSPPGSFTLYDEPKSSRSWKSSSGSDALSNYYTGGSGSGSLSRFSGLGRGARRQFAAILDEFWGHLFDLHGQSVSNLSTSKRHSKHSNAQTVSSNTSKDRPYSLQSSGATGDFDHLQLSSSSSSHSRQLEAVYARQQNHYDPPPFSSSSPPHRVSLLQNSERRPLEVFSGGLNRLNPSAQLLALDELRSELNPGSGFGLYGNPSIYGLSSSQNSIQLAAIQNPTIASLVQNSQSPYPPSHLLRSSSPSSSYSASSSTIASDLIALERMQRGLTNDYLNYPDLNNLPLDSNALLRIQESLEPYDPLAQKIRSLYAAKLSVDREKTMSVLENDQQSVRRGLPSWDPQNLVHLSSQMGMNTTDANRINNYLSRSSTTIQPSLSRSNSRHLYENYQQQALGSDVRSDHAGIAQYRSQQLPALQAGSNTFDNFGFTSDVLPIPFDELASSPSLRDALPSRSLQFPSQSHSSLWSYTPHQALLGQNEAVDAQKWVREAGGNSAQFDNPLQKSQIALQSQKQHLEQQQLEHQKRKDKPSKDSSLSINTEPEMMENLRAYFHRLIRLEGSDWLFRFDTGFDEDLIACVALREKMFRVDFSTGQVSGSSLIAKDRSGSSSEKNDEWVSSNSIWGCYGGKCLWNPQLIISFGVWCVHRILELSQMESRPELWGKYTYVLNRLQGVLEKAFLQPRVVPVLCNCFGEKAGMIASSLRPPRSYPIHNFPSISDVAFYSKSKGALASVFMDMIKDIENAISGRKGRTGTAAGDVAFPKGKENLASVLKRYKRRLGNKNSGSISPAQSSFSPTLSYSSPGASVSSFSSGNTAQKSLHVPDNMTQNNYF